jgi:hypothetical protein
MNYSTPSIHLPETCFVNKPALIVLYNFTWLWFYLNTRSRLRLSSRGCHGSFAKRACTFAHARGAGLVDARPLCYRPPQEGRGLPPQQRHATPLPALPSFFWCASPRAGPVVPAGPRSSRCRPLSPLPPPLPSRPKQRPERQEGGAKKKASGQNKVSGKKKNGGAKNQQGPSLIGPKFILQNVGQWHVIPASPPSPLNERPLS